MHSFHSHISSGSPLSDLGSWEDLGFRQQPGGNFNARSAIVDSPLPHRAQTLSPSVRPSIANLVDPPTNSSAPMRRSSCPSTLDNYGVRFDPGVVGSPTEPHAPPPQPQPLLFRPRPRMRPVPLSPSPFRPSEASNSGSLMPAVTSPAQPIVYAPDFYIPQLPFGFNNPVQVRMPLQPIAEDPDYSTPGHELPHFPELDPPPLEPALLIAPQPAPAQHQLSNNTKRNSTPSTVHEVTDAETPAVSPSSKSARSKAARTLKRFKALGDDEFRELLQTNRSRLDWLYIEELRIARFLSDPDHPKRRQQLRQKSKKGEVLAIFQQASSDKDCLNGSRDAKATCDHWNKVMVPKYGVIHRLQNITGGDGDADYVTGDPEQLALEKLGHRLKSAPKGMKTENLTVREYYEWVRDPVDGLYALMCDLLRDDVAAVRQKEFRSGAISPSPFIARVSTVHDDDTDSVVVISSDDAQTPPHKPKAITTSSGRLTRAAQRARKEESDGPELTATTGLAFVQQAQAYQQSRANTDKQRLELDQQRLTIERANEERAAQRLELEKDRLVLMKTEQEHAEEHAAKMHALDTARLALAQDHHKDLKRKMDLDEADRLRTDKRLRCEFTTKTALQLREITGEDEDAKLLRSASVQHLLGLFTGDIPSAE